LVPPLLDDLGWRLRRRGTEDEAAVQRRLARARAELDEAGWFDAVVVNDEVARAAGEIDRILAKR
jgi:guanylate kinase